MNLIVRPEATTGFDAITRDFAMRNRSGHTILRSATQCLVAFGLLIPVASVAWADDPLRRDGIPPFGLPAPVARAQAGSVILHGGTDNSSRITAESPVFTEFIKAAKLAAGTATPSVVVIPSGTYTIDDYQADEKKPSAMTFEQWVLTHPEHHVWSAYYKAPDPAVKVTIVYTDEENDQSDRVVGPLANAHGVWIPARYQGKLGYRFSPRYRDPYRTGEKAVSKVQTALRGVVARGGVVAGIGGGMSAMGETMILRDVPNKQYPGEASLRAGLAVLDRAIVDQHFEERAARLERLTALFRRPELIQEISKRASRPIADETEMIGLGVDKDTALCLNGSTIRVIGRGQGHVFVKGADGRTLTWHMIDARSPPFDAAAVRQAAPAVKASEIANPFGMPVSKDGTVNGIVDGTVKGTVVIHGGGSNSDLRKEYHRYAGRTPVKLVHCPLASEWDKFRLKEGEKLKDAQKRMRADQAGYWVKDWERSGRAIEFFSVRGIRDANDRKHCADLLDASAVWFAGGAQGPLVEHLIGTGEPTEFKKAVENVVRRGGVVGGTSAGAAFMSQVMIADMDRRAGGPAFAVVRTGLGVLGNVVVDQHFEQERNGDEPPREGRLERLTALLRSRNGELEAHGVKNVAEMLGMAVERGTALIIQRDRLEVFGGTFAHVFLRSPDGKKITWHWLRKGEVARIKKAGDGLVLVREGPGT